MLGYPPGFGYAPRPASDGALACMLCDGLLENAPWDADGPIPVRAAE